MHISFIFSFKNLPIQNSVYPCFQQFQCPSCSKHPKKVHKTVKNLQKSVFKWNTIWVFIFPKSCSWCPLGFFGTSTRGFLVVVFILLQSMKAQMLPKPILVWGTAPKIAPKEAKIIKTFSLILLSRNDLKLKLSLFQLWKWHLFANFQLWSN